MSIMKIEALQTFEKSMRFMHSENIRLAKRIEILEDKMNPQDIPDAMKGFEE